jgi:phytoene dehydrogenase-like protein
MKDQTDAVVVGSGPNGLAAAIEIARAGYSVTLFEAEATIGGGTRSAELTLPGFVHDVCSAVHPMAVSSPFFRSLPLSEHGLEWIHPLAPVAHPLDDGSAVILERDLDVTAASLGSDGPQYRALMQPLLRKWLHLFEATFAPPRFPRHPFLLARFGWHARQSALGLAQRLFRGERARALFGGLAAHAILPLENAFTATFALMFSASAHAVGWPLPRGGSQRIADALGGCLLAYGGRMITSTRIRRLDDLPAARVALCDITPRQLLRIAGDRLPQRYRRRLQRFRYGAGVFKVDWALSSPIPWQARECARAGTVHVGGSLSDIAAAEHAAGHGKIPDRPFVLLAQPSLFDPTRAPAGRHTAWGYCHVPNGSRENMLDRIEAQIERFAPGFRDCILARSIKDPAEMEEENENLVGGDINGGSSGGWQLFFRPTLRLYSTPLPSLFLCSASTPPGGGVHGMCGYYAAKVALKRLA